MATEILPYSKNTKNYCGSLGALEQDLGFDRAAMSDMAHDGIIAATAKDGHTWQIRKNMNLFVAWRPETPQEIKAGQEAFERRSFSTFFTIERQRLCTDIAWATRILSMELKPDNPPSRAKRRQIKAHMHEFGTMLTELLINPRVEIKPIRERYLEIQPR